MNKKIWILGFLLFPLLSCHQDGMKFISQNGMIYNGLNRAPIAGASVQLWKTTGGFWAGNAPVIRTMVLDSITGSDGRYVIDYVEQDDHGMFHLEIYAYSFEPLKHGEVRQDGKSATIDFPLWPSSNGGGR